MIETFYDTTAMNIRRSTPSPTGSDTIVTVSSFLCLFRPVVEVSRLYVENNIGKEFDCLTDNSVDLRVGDTIYANSDSYDVLGVANFKDLEDDIDSHLDVRVVKK